MLHATTEHCVSDPPLISPVIKICHISACQGLDIQPRLNDLPKSDIAELDAWPFFVLSSNVSFTLSEIVAFSKQSIFSLIGIDVIVRMFPNSKSSG